MGLATEARESLVTKRTPPSVVPPSRLFPAPATPFDTEVAVLRAACVVRDDSELAGVSWIAHDDAPDAALCAIVRGEGGDGEYMARHLTSALSSASRAPELAVNAQRSVVVASVDLADRMAAILAAASFVRSDDVFFGIAAEELAHGARLALDPLVGDDAWRDWIAVERQILAESIAPAPLTSALLDRTVEFKRRQQRHSPPIRRFVGRDERGAPIAMIGYAPFAPCDLGFATKGVLVRLRDVAVAPAHRGRGVGTSLLRGIAARVIDECGATQVMIGAAETSAAIYRSVGAKELGRYVTFRG